MDKNEVAEKMFDAPYSHLSAWGQKHVDDVMVKMGFVEAPQPTLPGVDDHAKLQRDNERLARELESSRIENLELWDENTELKAELEQLRSEFNPPDNSI